MGQKDRALEKRERKGEGRGDLREKREKWECLREAVVSAMLCLTSPCPLVLLSSMCWIAGGWKAVLWSQWLSRASWSGCAGAPFQVAGQVFPLETGAHP